MLAGFKKFIIRLVLLWSILGCSHLAMADQGGWEDRVAKLLVPRWQTLQDELQQIEDELLPLPKIHLEDTGGTGGLAIFARGAVVDEINQERVIEVHWAKPVPVDLIALIPARKYQIGGVNLDYGLPDDFSVELIGGKEEAATEEVTTPIADERRVRSSSVRSGYPLVYSLEKPVIATGLRIKVHRLHDKESAGGGNFTLAFSEVFCFSQGRNVARGAQVSTSSQLLTNAHWHWRNSFLVDGKTPLGLPEIPSILPNDIGWLSKDRKSEDTAAWVVIDLGKPRSFNGLRVYPVRRPSKGNIPGFGLPRHFHVGISDSNTPGSYRRVVDYTDRKMENPGHNFIELNFPTVKARYVRFEATKLWKPFESYPAFLAISEVEVLDGSKNIALGSHAISSDSIGRVPAHDDLVWSEASLTDGFGPRGKLVSWADWLLGLDQRRRLEVQRQELTLEAEALTSEVRQWVLGLLIILGLCGIVFPVILPIRARLMRRREVMRVRKRIAGDLHDEVGSNLGGIQLYAELASQRSHGSSELAVVQELAAETVTAVRDIVWLLLPHSTQGRCFVDHLKETGSILLEKMEWTFDADDNVRGTAISDALARDLLLFYREALHNLRHAEAQAVSIQMRKHDHRLTLSISDDGCGIPAEILNRESTLRALKQRAERMHGDLELRSIKGSGTTVILTLPL